MAAASGPTGGWKRLAAGLGLGVVVAAGIAVAESVKPDPTRLAVQPVSVEARALPSFDRTDMAETRFGKLEWRGGLVLASETANFGGWSGLEISPDGRTLFAVSDAGTWFKANLVYEAGRPAGLRNALIGPLKARDGKTLSRGRDQDAEAVVLESGTLDKGSVLIGFEQNDRIGRFTVADKGPGAPTQYLDMPPESRSMRINGFETVAVLRGGALAGSVVALAEQAGKGGVTPGWIWIDGKPKRFAIGGAAGFEVTDAKGLADGSLVLLERRFRWTEGVKLRVSLVPSGSLKPDAVVSREVLLAADMDQEIDNMEGLAVHSGARGETILTLISDDNFNKFLQRTVLLQFALKHDAVASKPKEAVAETP